MSSRWRSLEACGGRSRRRPEARRRKPEPPRSPRWHPRLNPPHAEVGCRSVPASPAAEPVAPAAPASAERRRGRGPSLPRLRPKPPAPSRPGRPAVALLHRSSRDPPARPTACARLRNQRPGHPGDAAHGCCPTLPPVLPWIREAEERRCRPVTAAPAGRPCRRQASAIPPPWPARCRFEEADSAAPGWAGGDLAPTRRRGARPGAGRSRTSTRRKPGRRLQPWPRRGTPGGGGALAVLPVETGSRQAAVTRPPRMAGRRRRNREELQPMDIPT